MAAFNRVATMSQALQLRLRGFDAFGREAVASDEEFVRVSGEQSIVWWATGTRAVTDRCSFGMRTSF